MTIVMVGIDLAKAFFAVRGIDAADPAKWDPVCVYLP